MLALSASLQSILLLLLLFHLPHGHALVFVLSRKGPDGEVEAAADRGDGLVAVAASRGEEHRRGKSNFFFASLAENRFAVSPSLSLSL